MARPIVIEFAADVRDFLRKMRGVEDGLDDVADELQEAARDADRFETQFGSAMKDAERDAERSSKRIGRSFDKVDDDLGDVGREAGDEFQSNLGEALSSGNLEDIATDTVGGLVGSLKGATGGFLAAGAALALALYQGYKKEAERLRQLLEDEFGFYDLYTSEMDRIAEVQNVVATFGGGSEAEGWKKVQDYATTLKLTTEEVVALLSGDMTAANQANLDLLKQQREDQGFIEVSTGNELGYRQDLIDAADEALGIEAEGLELAKERYNYLKNEGLLTQEQMVQGWQNIYNYAADTLQAVKDIPTDVQVKLQFYATGPGAAYINPNSSSYSPGHVAIANMYTNQAG